MFQKITVAECIETQSKAMMMLTLEQLSYLLKFALQKMKQPGVSSVAPVFSTPPVLCCENLSFILIWLNMLFFGFFFNDGMHSSLANLYFQMASA